MDNSKLPSGMGHALPVRKLQPEIEAAVVHGGGLIAVRQHPSLSRAIYAACEAGVLVRLHPGVYAASSLERDLLTTLRAVALWRPDAVVTGRAAAKLSYWPDVGVDTITVATSLRPRARSTLRWSRRDIPSEWRMRFRGVTMTKPALTAIDLIDELGKGAVLQALRQRVAYDHLVAAAGLAWRPRARSYRTLVRELRHQPWSEAEVIAHQLLRSARIRGWIANCRVRIGSHSKILDIVFEDLQVAIEIDGYQFHSLAAERNTFETDRFFSNLLIAHGWLILRLTWRHLTEQPEQTIDLIRRTCTLRKQAHRTRRYQAA